MHRLIRMQSPGSFCNSGFLVRIPTERRQEASEEDRSQPASHQHASICFGRCSARSHRRSCSYHTSLLWLCVAPWWRRSPTFHEDGELLGVRLQPPPLHLRLCRPCCCRNHTLSHPYNNRDTNIVLGQQKPEEGRFEIVITGVLLHRDQEVLRLITTARPSLGGRCLLAEAPVSVAIAVVASFD